MKKDKNTIPQKHETEREAFSFAFYTSIQMTSELQVFFFSLFYMQKKLQFRTSILTDQITSLLEYYLNLHSAHKHWL